MTCPSTDEVLKLALGEARMNDACELERHLAGCARCRSERDRLTQLLSDLAAPVAGEAHAQAFVDRVVGSLPHAAAAGGKRRPAAFGPLSAVAAVLLLAAPVAWTLRRAPHAATGKDGGFVARGSEPAGDERLVGAEVLRLRGGTLESAWTDEVRASDAFAVRGSNLTNDMRYLMAFGIDGGGTVHWLYPAFVDPATDPSAVPLEPGTRDRVLGEIVQPEDVAPGPLRLVTVVCPAARRVSEVEAAATGRPAIDIGKGLFADCVLRETVTTEAQR